MIDSAPGWQQAVRLVDDGGGAPLWRQKGGKRRGTRCPAGRYATRDMIRHTPDLRAPAKVWGAQIHRRPWFGASSS